MITTKITRNGQVTLPKTLRDLYQWNEGDMILFENSPQGVILRHVPAEADEESNYYKMLDHSMSDWADPIHDNLFKNI